MNDHREEKDENCCREETPQQQIIEMGSSLVENRRGTVQCLTIIGQIEGHTLLPPTMKSTKYEHVLPLLTAVEERDDIDGLLLLLNTVGGDVEAGLGIAELLAGMTTPTVTLSSRSGSRPRFFRVFAPMVAISIRVWGRLAAFSSP